MQIELVTETAKGKVVEREMKCNVKGHRLDRNVFGEVYPVFRNAERKGKFREPDETKRGLEDRKKLMYLIHANF